MMIGQHKKDPVNQFSLQGLTDLKGYYHFIQWVDMQPFSSGSVDSVKVTAKGFFVTFQSVLKSVTPKSLFIHEYIPLTSHYCTYP